MICFLCNVRQGDTDLPLHDRPLDTEHNVGFVIPGKGALSPGYILISPTQHATSLRAAAFLDPAFAGYVARALELAFQRFGPLTLWEHGSSSGSGAPRSACIEHAHLNVIAGTFSFPLPPNAVRADDIGSLQWDLQNEPYLLYGTYPGNVYLGDDVAISQYYRRYWARAVDREEEWDYLVTRDSLDIAWTIDAFSRDQPEA